MFDLLLSHAFVRVTDVHLPGHPRNLLQGIEVHMTPEEEDQLKRAFEEAQQNQESAPKGVRLRVDKRDRDLLRRSLPKGLHGRLLHPVFVGSIHETNVCANRRRGWADVGLFHARRHT